VAEVAAGLRSMHRQLNGGVVFPSQDAEKALKRGGVMQDLIAVHNARVSRTCAAPCPAFRSVVSRASCVLCDSVFVSRCRLDDFLATVGLFWTVWTVNGVTMCQCNHFLQYAACKHTVARGIVEKTVLVPHGFVTEKIGAMKKKGRPAKARPALVNQDRVAVRHGRRERT